MKKTFLILAVGLMLLVSACGSDRNTNGENDSLMSDSALMDTGTASQDTAGLSSDSLGTDSMAVNP